MKAKRDFVRKRMSGNGAAILPDSTSYFLGLDGIARPIKARGQSPLFLTFHGISAGLDQLNDTPYGLAQTYAVSVLAWRCINVIADTFAGLMLKFTDAHGDDLPKTHPLVRALGSGGARLKRATAKDMQLWGVAYWELRDKRRPLRLNPLTMEKEADRHGIQFFRQNVEGSTAVFEPHDLLYFYDYDPLDDFGSVSPTQLALRSIGVETGLEEFVKTFLQNYAVPAGLLSTDNTLLPSDADRYKEDWKRRYGSSHAGEVAVLGHGLTYQTITPLLKDLVLDTLGESAARSVCQAYGVPLTMALATEAANYATFKESHQILYTETILPFADKVFGVINERPDAFNGAQVEVNEQEIAVLQEDRTEVTQRAQMGFQAGYLTMNEARDLENLAPLPGGDFVVIGGQFVTTRQIESGQLPTPPVSPFMNTPLLEANPAKALGSSFCLMYQIGADPDLVALQNQLKNKFEGVNWTDPQDFHITLVYAPSTDEDVAKAICEQIKALDIPQPKLQVGSLRTFDNLGEHALHFRVRRNADLLNFQHELVELCRDAGLELSAYSDPTQYIPHITMGYSPEHIPAVTFHSKLMVAPQLLLGSMETSKDVYETILNQPCGAVIEAPSKALLELDKWQRKATEKRKNAPFEVEYLPSAFADFLRMELEACDGSIATVFDRAREALKADHPDFATPEEFERYWRGIGGLYSSLARVFTASFPDLRKQLAAAVREGTVQETLTAWSEARMHDLVGTVDDPGVLTRIYLAGAARGSNLLENARLSANPQKAVSLEVDWTVINTNAVDWARQYAAQLVRGINDTTQAMLQEKTAAWLEAGNSLADLAKAIEGDLHGLDIPPGWSPDKIAWATSPERAALIAQTESTNAYHQGVTERWKQAGVTHMRWRTQNDRLVCPICRGLNNRTGTLTLGIRWQGKYYRPAAHPGCRCFVAPVES